MNQSNQQAILSPCALTLCTNTCDYHLPTTLTPLLDNTKIVYEYHIPLFIPLKTCGREKLYSGSVYILWSKVTDTVYCYCGQTQKILVPFLKHKSKVLPQWRVKETRRDAIKFSSIYFFTAESTFNLSHFQLCKCNDLLLWVAQFSPHNGFN